MAETSDHFLIAHKVRGEPALDIAIQMFVDNQPEPWWIIPTSGHRAYPYWFTSLKPLLTGERSFDTTITLETEIIIPAMPDDWPDHYSANDTYRRKVFAQEFKLGLEESKNILDQLGL